jgi:hypothetical protein
MNWKYDSQVRSMESVPSQTNIISALTEYSLEPNARVYNLATLFLGEINTGTLSSRLGEV